MDRFVICPQNLRINIWKYNFNFPLNMITVPIICVGIALGSFNVTNVITNGLNGSNVHPWEVLAILYSCCYICISLQKTKMLDRFASKLASFCETTFQLYLCIYFLTSVITIITNNDISIVVVTPLGLY